MGRRDEAERLEAKRLAGLARILALAEWRRDNLPGTICATDFENARLFLYGARLDVDGNKIVREKVIGRDPAWLAAVLAAHDENLPNLVSYLLAEETPTYDLEVLDTIRLEEGGDDDPREVWLIRRGDERVLFASYERKHVPAQYLRDWADGLRKTADTIDAFADKAG